MSDPRITGLILMLTAIAAFLGTTADALPSVTFFPALILFIAGAVKFMKKTHMALEAAEERAHRAVNPVNPIIRENRHAQAHAQRQAERQGSALSHFDDCARNANSIASTVPGYIAPGESIEVGDPDNELVVATDVSFPVADQTGNALADQLGKLNQLLEQGVLTAEEYAVAKTKLLI